MEQRIARIERHLTRRNAWLALLLLTAISGFFGYTLKDIRLDHDFERFFPTDDPELDRYLAFREEFGHDNDQLLIGIGNSPSIFDREFLLRVDTLAAQLAAVPDMLEMITPTRMKEPRVTPLGVFQVPLLRTESQAVIERDSARIWRDGRLLGSLIAPDGEAMIILLRTAPGLSKIKSDRLLQQVNDLIEESGLTEVRMGGRVHAQYWYIEKMWNELVFFLALSIGLLTIFLALVNRTLWGVLVPIGVVGLAVLWQVGAITAMGRPLSILTMLLPTILFVVGMSDVVHVLERYIEVLRQGAGKRRALAQAYHEVGLATFLTSVTTAIGFSTLATSSILPIREFGMFTAIGVFMAFILAFTLLPAVLLLLPTPVRAARSENETLWHPLLTRLYAFVLRNSRTIPWAFAIIAVFSAFSISTLKVDNQLLEDWAEDDPQKIAYYWLEEHFGGVRPFEVEVKVIEPEADIWDLDVLRDMEKVEAHLHDHHGISALISPAEMVRSANMALNGGSLEFHRLPESQAEVDRVVESMRTMTGKERLGNLVSENGRSARISGRMRDEGGHVHRQRDEELQAFIAANTDRDRIRFAQTGMAYLIDRNNERLSSQLIGGLSIAFLLIAAIIAMVFRNWRMTLIALVPNVIPLLVIGGIMGLAGIDIKVSTAIIFTIAFGICVDDTIHLLGKLRIELLKGRDLRSAMERSFLSTGKALILTTVLLLSGFLSLVTSDLASVYYMGLLVSLTLAIALITDLLLLPILVLRWTGTRTNSP